MDPAEREQGTRDLAAALQRNTNIETLELWKLDDLYAIPILEGLRLNTAVKTFIFSAATFFGCIVPCSSTLLDSTTSIQRFELRNEMSFVERLFRPIAQAITNSECVSELKFWWVRFQDQSSIAQLQSILQNKRNLTSLCLHYCSFGGGQVHEDIISLVSRPDSLLRCFEFQSGWVFGRCISENSIQEPASSNRKEQAGTIQIGSIETPHQLQTLTQSIPLMRIKELE